jgi:hypothetical protein
MMTFRPTSVPVFPIFSDVSNKVSTVVDEAHPTYCHISSIFYKPSENAKTSSLSPCNKNLVPVIMERVQYIRRILQDHLCDESTYLRLSE